MIFLCFFGSFLVLKGSVVSRLEEMARKGVPSSSSEFKKALNNWVEERNRKGWVQQKTLYSPMGLVDVGAEEWKIPLPPEANKVMMVESSTLGKKGHLKAFLAIYKKSRKLFILALKMYEQLLVNHPTTPKDEVNRRDNLQNRISQYLRALNSVA